MTFEHGGFLPTHDEMMVLSACMLDPQAARDQWIKWRERHALSDLNVAQGRLLPLVYHNLMAAGYSEQEDMAVLRKAYQTAAHRVDALWQCAVPAFKALQDAGVPPLLLKGMALGQLCYPDRHTRTMADIDIIVPFDQAEQAMAALRNAGWVSDEPLENWSRSNFHACTFRNAENRQLDLHWHLYLGARDDDDKILWERAQPLNTDIGEVLTLSESDHLFHCCIHGYAWSPLHPMRWIVDAHMLYRHAQGRIDWQYMVEQAKERRKALRLRKALEVLQEIEVLAVPARVMQELGSAPIARWEQAEHDFITTAAPAHPSEGHKKMRLLKMAWFKHRRYHRGQSLAACLWTFPAMLSKEMCLGNVWLLPWAFIRLTGRILRPKTT